VDPGSGAAPPEVEVQAGGAADIRLLPPRIVTLRILDAATGQLVTGSIEVHVTTLDGTRSTLYTNSTGEISLVPPDGAQVVVVAEGYEPTEPFGVRVGPGVVEEVRVTKTPAATGRVTLVLRDAKGEPITEVQVLRVREMGAPGASGIKVNGLKISPRNVVTVTVPLAQTAPEGRVTIELPAGENEIRVRPKAGGTAATVVVSVEGGGESVREIDFARLGSLRVTFKYRPPLRLFRDGTAVHPDAKWEQGRVVYSGLEPGPVRLEAIFGGGPPAVLDAEILPGGETEVRF
jgi:hypothetical protein